ncbi:MAG: DUF1631 family protein, partial [Gammaproteobacteria bacterium]
MAISGERAQFESASSDDYSGLSSDDRRRHVRQALQVGATVGIEGGPSRACQIKDFCVGGLFLSVEGTNGSGIVIGDKTLERHDELIVQFSAQMKGKVTVFEVTVLVERVVDGGMGVSFEGRNGVAIHALNHLLTSSSQAMAPAAANRGVPDDVVNVADASSILAAYRRRVLAFLESNLAALFDHARDSLFASARDTRAREEQSTFFGAIQELDGLKEPIQTAFLDAMASQLQQPGTILPGTEALVSETGTLDVVLVDTGTFDDWVIIKDMVSRAAPKYDKRQREIAARLSKLVNVAITDD